MKRVAALFVILSVPAAPGAAAAEALLPGDAAHGQKLHAAHCRGCHDDALYTRAQRRVKTLEGLMGQVNGCNKQLGKNFTRDQIADLVRFLNDRYYRFE
jgi:mono/diheme cytochrome c family protein